MDHVNQDVFFDDMLILTQILVVFLLAIGAVNFEFANLMLWTSNISGYF